MKTMKKIIFFVFSCIAFANLPTHCFYYDGRPSGALTGAAIGGLAGGRKGAAIGLGVGAFSDIASSAATNNRRRQSDDDYYYERQERRKAQKRHRSVKQQLEDCEDENDALKDEIKSLQRQLQKK